MSVYIGIKENSPVAHSTAISGLLCGKAHYITHKRVMFHLSESGENAAAVRRGELVERFCRAFGEVDAPMYRHIQRVR
jgi:hypothetical protein